VYHRAEKINLNEAPRSDLFCTFAASIVERFDLIATTRKNAKPMLFPSLSVNCFPHKFIIN
jgi:hypothetical protein